MNPVIIIPALYTMHTRRDTDQGLNSYDHPTPIHEEGELPRLLDSLNALPGVSELIILVSAEEEIQARASEKVHEICSRYPDLSCLIIGEAEYALIAQRLEELGVSQVAHGIGLQGYSALRNLGLMVAHVFNFDSVIFLDDDEIVEDPEFMNKAVYGLGKLTRKGIPILAKTGFYYDRHNSYYSQQSNAWDNYFWQQGRAFNSMISQAMRGPRLSRSSYVCGGCMALHKEAFKRMAFDPWVVRGEDLDYMLNLRMYGSDIWFDNTWSVRHLPPRTKREGLRFRQDVYRWLYEYRKMEFSRSQIDLIQVKASSLVPYPGPFLEPGIDKKMKRTARLRSLVRPDKKNYRRALRAISGDAASYAEENCGKYFEFQFVWPTIMERIEEDKGLMQALLQSTGCSSLNQAQSSPVKMSNIDPGSTAEIHLNLSDFE